MSGLTSHLIRRAVESDATAAAFSHVQKVNVSGWGVALVAITTLIYLAMVLTVAYVYGCVVPTLAMVESPNDKAYLSVDAAKDLADALDKNDDKTAAEIEPEMLVVKRPLVTSSLRSARRFLVAQGGLRAAFRGVGLFLVSTFLAGFFDKLLQQILLPRMFLLTPFISGIVSTVLVSRYLMTWTHIVVSEPSPKWWWRRLPPAKTFLAIAPATALWAAAEHLSVLLPNALFYGLELNRPLDVSGDADSVRIHLAAVASKHLLVLFFTLCTFVLLALPARVMLTRVQTSLLPQDEDTIVSVDRTFGGKVEEGAKLGLLDAWRSFGWVACARLLVLYLKVAMIQVFLSVLFFVILVAELQAVTGTTARDWSLVVNAKINEQRTRLAGGL